MILRISFLLLALVVGLGLSACGGAGTGSVTANQNNTTTEMPQPEKPKEPTQLEQEQVNGTLFSAFTKKLQDGRVVQCVGETTYRAATVDCDFANAK